MSVVFVNAASYELQTIDRLRKQETVTLFGKPFPPDDVKAYWSLVPETITVEWSAAFSMFFVKKLYVADRDPPEHMVRAQIMATDAHRLDVWMSVISRLVCTA